MTEALHGHLYKVNKMMLVKRNGDRRVVIEEGEIIEFRYFSDVHFRTADNIYCEVSREVFSESVTLYGKIFENIRFRNQNSLQEILDAKLYD